jgi:multiple sugar transport system permease protein
MSTATERDAAILGAAQPGTAGPVPPSRARRHSGRRREGWAAWILALPFCLLFLVFTLWPVAQSLFMSFTDTKAKDLRTPFSVDIIGVENYTRAFSDETFLHAIRNTAYFVLLGVPLTMTLALAAAVALDRGITKFRSLFRLGFYTPVVTSIVAVAVVWQFLLQNDFGLINTALGWVGIDGPNWLGDANWSMPGLIMMAAWRNFGTGMIIFLAGLQAVPWMLHEAAAIDGANAWQRFRHITLPLLRPVILFVSVTTIIGYLQFFEEPYVMTSGGPLDSTISMSLYTYKQFGFGNYGYAAALGYIIFVAVAVITALQFRALRENT